MGGGEGDVGEAREIGDERRRAHAAGEILGADGERQHQGIVADHGLDRVHEIRQQLQNPADEQAAIETEALRRQPAHGDAGECRHESKQLADVGDLDLAEAHIDVKRIRHHAGERVAELVEHDEHQHGEPTRPLDEIAERRDHRRFDPGAGTRGGRVAGQGIEGVV